MPRVLLKTPSFRGCDADLKTNSDASGAHMRVAPPAFATHRSCIAAYQG
jgi:hypothetical protein